MKYNNELYRNLVDTLSEFIHHTCNGKHATNTSRDVFCHLAILSEVIGHDSMKTTDLVGRCVNLISVGSHLMCRLEPSYHGSETHQLCCTVIKHLSELCEVQEHQISYWLDYASGN
ncbi:hypothetical protein DN38_1080 [Vibrio cholerae]|nr:hypothetical protein DN38_1080 [Vibrio cholerae]GIC21659.1 hypothetical protein VCSRO53_1333 [Vibrio cholerae]